MIRALIFDCFGVLYNEGKSYVMKACPSDRIDDLKSLYYQSDYGYISREDFLQSISSLVGMTVDEFLQTESREYVRNQPLFAYIRHQKRSYKTGLLSNVGEGFLESLIDRSELDELFDQVVTSSSVGVVKPAREIYEIMADRLGIPTDECVFIDDIPANVDGATRAGMKGLLYTTNHQLEVDLARVLGNGDA